MKKSYKNIDEWQKAKPTEEEMKKVLEFLNRRRISDLRNEKRNKERELKKYDKLLKSLSELEQKPWPELQGSVDTLNAEIKEITKELADWDKAHKKVAVVKVKGDDKKAS